jgi:hypothetical protein
VGPADANSGRGELFRASITSGNAITALVLGASVALLAGAYFGGPAVAAGAPVGAVLVIAGIVFWLADRRAEEAFWKHVAASLGFTRYGSPVSPETTTPLLHAGDRRFWDHQMTGPLGDSGLSTLFSQYRYDVREENEKGEESWDSYYFTICLVELEAGMQLFPGVYLRAKRGLLGGLGKHDWLRGRRLEEVELESTEFNDIYELQIAPEQDDGRLRELFDPKTILWLQDHPLRPHIEFRAGFLVVYVPEHIEDMGRVVWLLEAAEKIAERVQQEIGESSAAVG